MPSKPHTDEVHRKQRTVKNPIKFKISLNEEQKEAKQKILDNTLTLLAGRAGSGKTLLACQVALDGLIRRHYSKIIITRPVVESGRGIGFLPGSLNEKVHPYMVPIIEEMKLYLGMETYNSMRTTNTIEICPLEYMRGRNFHNTFMILDEAQNATFEQIKMFMTRIGIGSKAVINGDLDQTDLKGESGGLLQCMDCLTSLMGVGICYLTSEDIVRNGIISKILKRLK